LPRWRIATQRQHIADAAIPEIVEDAPDFVGGVSDAGEMRHRADLLFALDALDELDGLLARAPARPVRHRNIARLDRVQLGDGLVKLSEAGVGLGREILKRNSRPAGTQDLVDAHGSECTAEDDKVTR